MALDFHGSKADGRIHAVQTLVFVSILRCCNPELSKHVGVTLTTMGFSLEAGEMGIAIQTNEDTGKLLLHADISHSLFNYT